MGYLDDHLLDGERIAYRARLHRIVFLVPFVLLLLALAAAAIALSIADPDVKRAAWIAAAVLGVLTLAVGVGPWIRYRTSEFAVTNRRVLMKLGFIQRDSLDMLLSKVEAIQVDQDFMGRMLGYGTINVIGTGGTAGTYARISRPLEFRRQVQMQSVAVEESRRAGALPGGGASASGEPRIERECPWCAERILARAKVCRYCGRDVPPVEAAG